MNLAEALLAADKGKLTAAAKKTYEVKRLSELLGEPFILELQQIPNQRVKEIRESAISYNGEDPETDEEKLCMGFICDGIVNKDFNNKELLKAYGVATKKELFLKLFNAGELLKISGEICKLCGFVKDKSKIKN